MKKIFVLSFMFLIAFTALAEQSFKIKFYRKNGQEPLTYNIYDIQKIGIKNISDKYVMKIHYQDTNTAYYPVMSIDSVKFETDTNQVKVFTPYIFGSPIPYYIAEIDSIIFNEIDTKINEDVVVVDSANSKKIIILDSAGLILDKSSPLTKDLKTGDIITGEPSDNAPDGFLKKVKSIKTEGDSVIIETEDAKITDVIENGVISFEIEFTPQDTAKQKYHRKDDEILADEGFTIGFDDIVVYDHDGNKNTKNDQIKIDGTNTFTPKLAFNLVVQDWKVKQLLIQLSLKNTLGLTAHSNLEFEKTFQTSLNELLGIPAIQLPPVVVPVGVCPFCIPVTITSNIDLQVGVTINVGAEVSTGIALENSAVAGLEYNSGTWKKISEQTSSFDFSPPELSLGGSIKGFVGPQLNINFFNLQDAFNAYVNVFGFGELEVDILNKPLWQLSAGIEANAGVESEWWKELDYELPFVLEYRKLLAQSRDLISSVTPSQAKVGDEITITGTGFGNTRGGSYVRFKFGNSMLPIDAIQATEYTSWSDEEIKVKVPNGLNPGDVKLLVNVGGFLCNQTNFKVISTPQISSINPTSLKIGDVMTITGTNFGSEQNTSFATFNGTKATEYTSWSNTQIKVKVPTGTTSGKVSVTVYDQKSNEVDFTINQDNFGDVVLIPSGNFQMGNTGAYSGYYDEKPVHTVTLTNSFYMGKYEVTQALWKSVMGTNPSYFKGDSLPVETVCWFEAVDFCNKLSDRDGLPRCYTINMNGASTLCDSRVTVTCDWTKKGWRLPTEAEWEYAAKAGTSTDFYSGQLTNSGCSPLDNNLKDIAWYCGNSSNKTHNVGGKTANDYGLYDMSGNVWEWCWDWYSSTYYSGGAMTDPKGPTSGSYRVYRGGCWSNLARYCRGAYRGDYYPDSRTYYVGFRVVLPK